MARSQQWQSIPTILSFEQFQQFVLPHLTVGSRGPAPKLTLHTVFNYILRLLYLGCQWKELPIERDQEGRAEIHYTRIYSAFRKWQADGCFDAVFAGSVSKLHQADFLDATVIHGDGTTTAAKKGGDNIATGCGFFVSAGWKSRSRKQTCGKATSTKVILRYFAH